MPDRDTAVARLSSMRKTVDGQSKDRRSCHFAVARAIARGRQHATTTLNSIGCFAVEVTRTTPNRSRIE